MTIDAVLAIRNKLYIEREQALNEYEDLANKESALIKELEKIREELAKKQEYADALKEAAEQLMTNINIKKY